ncbi:MAG: UvrD-helicase domain-containing protein [Oscillospiraceae bacterium]
MQWTAAQSAAISDTGGSLLVSAAAGSGKTAVLVERAARILMDAQHPVSADRLLIVTFTRAAAGELRERIDLRLAEADAHGHNTYLRRQRMLLGRANICTIDSFCMQLLRQYFEELSLPPDFENADDASVFKLRAETISLVMEQMSSDADFCDFASMYGRSRNDNNAQTAVLGLYDFLRSVPFFDKTLNKICADWQGDTKLSETAWGKSLFSEAQKLLASAHAIEETALINVRQEEALSPYIVALQEDIAFINAMELFLNEGRWDDAAVYAQQYKPSAFKPVRGFEGVLIDAVKAMRGKAKDVFAKLRTDIFICTEIEFDEDRARIAPMINALARAVRLFSNEFYKAKLRDKILEYSDYEHLALELLCDENGNKTAIANAVSDGFDAVMVDEFQDTNALQSLLYKCLSNEEQSNMFLVGDIKQSIYRFRLAQPKIFLEKKDNYAAFASGLHPAVLTLGHNFRSAKNVIEQVNYIFSVIMSRGVGAVDYDDNERLYLGNDDGYNGGAMDIKLVEETGHGDMDAVADTIISMVQSGYTVREKNGAQRPCTFGDFCILLRTRAKFAAYSSALCEKGVPVYADSSENCLTSPEVLPLLSLLRVIDNPAQDVHLAAALLSPIFGFTPSELTQVRAQTPKGSLYTAILHSQSEKIKAFLSQLSYFRVLAATVPCGELCSEIFARTHYFAAVGAMKAGEAKRDNLRAFVAYVNNASMGASGLSGFLRMLELMGDKASVKASDAPAIPADTVSIMTVHRSKGLEFPICIMADASHGFNLRDISNPVLFHEELGIGLTLRSEGGDLYKTAAHRAINLAERTDAISEEMRILYVALTRARDKLIVTMPLANPQKLLSDLAITLNGTHGANATILSGVQSFAPWICTAALLHPDCDNLRKETGILLPIQPTDSHINAEIISPQSISGEHIEQITEKAMPDDDICDILLSEFENEKKAQSIAKLPIKVSVSSIVHGSLQRTLARPSFLYAKGLTAAERGTALHSFLQFADFASASANLQGEVDRLVENAFIKRDIADKLELDDVRLFLSSLLVKRIASADKIFREYDFITSITANKVADTPKDDMRQVLVQGIADLVIVKGKCAELVDYKTDKGKTAEELQILYSKQLLLYRDAIQKRLGIAVEKCTIYSFALHAEIDIPIR